MSDYPFFPLFVDLSQKNVLVVGAGRIACRRILTLVQFTGQLTVTAPAALPEIVELARQGRLTLQLKEYEEADIEGSDLVCAATNDGELNRKIGEACRDRGIPVNVASDRMLSDFYFPGVARRGPVVAGVTASGRDHAAAKRATELVREALEKL